MRTKTLLLAAAVSAAGIAAIQAQSNVYSLNVVGYYNIVVPGGGAVNATTRLKLSTVALKNTAVATPMLSNVLTNVPAGLQVHTWLGALGWSGPNEYIGPADGWETDRPLPYGEGFFLKNPTPNPMTVTIVGEVMQGALVNAWPGELLHPAGSQVPQAGKITTDLGFTNVGAALYTFNNPGAGWSGLNELLSNPPAEWELGEPTLAVGEAVMFRKVGGTAWNRNFTVQ